MEVNTGMAARTYKQLYKDIRKVHPKRYKTATKENLFIEYLEKGYIPKEITLDDFKKLRKYTNNHMGKNSKSSALKKEFEKLNIGQCKDDNEESFLKFCGENWKAMMEGTVKSASFGVYNIGPDNHTSNKKRCLGQSLSQQNTTSSTSEIKFVDCGETIKLEIKEENEIDDEMNALADPLTVKSEHREDIIESGESRLESELTAKSIDCKETTNVEIKHEIQETEDLQSILFLQK